MPKIVVPLTDEQAAALAEMVKRAGYPVARSLSADEAECRSMIDGISALRTALADAGFAPR